MVMMDLDQNLFPSTASFGAPFFPWIIIIMSFNIARCWCHDQWPYHLRGKGSGVLIKELHDSHVGRASNDCNGSTICIYHEQKTSDSDVLRIHILYVMDTFSTLACHERKPRLHDGTVTEDTDKYRLVRSPPSGREPPDVGLTRIRKAPRTQPS